MRVPNDFRAAFRQGITTSRRLNNLQWIDQYDTTLGTNYLIRVVVCRGQVLEIHRRGSWVEYHDRADWLASVRALLFENNHDRKYARQAAYRIIMQQRQLRLQYPNYYSPAWI